MSNKYFELVPITKDINHGEYIVAYNERDSPHLWVESSYYGSGKWTNLERTDSMRLPKFYVSPVIPTETDEKEAEKYADEKSTVMASPSMLSRAFLAGILRERASGKGWVKVEDGLPEHKQKVLFVLDNCETRMGSFLKKDQWDRVNMFCDGSFFTSESVVYWMPVPEKQQKNVDKGSQ
jgi:hypothetical protein